MTGEACHDEFGLESTPLYGLPGNLSQSMANDLAFNDQNPGNSKAKSAAFDTENEERYV